MTRSVKLSDLTHNLDDERPPRKRALAGGLIALLVLAVGAAVLYLAPKIQLSRDLSAQKSVPRSAAVEARPEKPAGGDRVSFTPPVRELMQYVAALKAGQAAYLPSLSGEEAAKRLRYSRLFASAYEEVAVVAGKQPDFKTIVASFEAIIREEQGIDYLISYSLLVTPIAFLRALQNGDVAFPAPTQWAPTPEFIMGQLAEQYPDVPLQRTDETFAQIYRATREFTAQRTAQAGQISVYEIIPEIRRRIIASIVKPQTEEQLPETRP